MVVCFDLQNVTVLPCANASFFKRKLDIYNLTALASKEKVGYCEIWHKTMCRQSGNEIASF